MSDLQENLQQVLRSAGVNGEIELTAPPKSELGDFAFSCFALAKEQKQSPVEVAKELAQKIKKSKNSRSERDFAPAQQEIIERVEAMGPYVNFWLNSQEVARLVMSKSKPLAAPAIKNSQEKILVEFAHPNTHKAFHIGHLRNIITGESLVRLFEHVGHIVIRANYQGDVGLHIAKCLYGMLQIKDLNLKIQDLESTTQKAEFLGDCYAAGASAYEADEQARVDMVELNQKIYNRDPEILDLYTTTRQWSLDYFEQNIYQRLGTHFDRLYFESEVFKRGLEIVRAGVAQEIFVQSDGAVIFAGSKYGLHERVFLNSRGLPTYEAKDLALAELQFKEFSPAHIYHVVANEQAEYFKVVFKALEFTLPESKGRERHLVYGWVTLKSGKMSSRTGAVVLAEWLLDEAKKSILATMANSQLKDAKAVAERVAIAAVKYAFLRTSTANDIAFDLQSAIATTGDSGAYLLYMCARIKSILRKVSAGAEPAEAPVAVAPQEKALLLYLDQFQTTVGAAASQQDPSRVAHYLFALGQKFTAFYEACPVLKAEGAIKAFRLGLLENILQVVERGLYLLGIETVEEM